MASSMLPIGQLIWVSVRPLIRLMVCVGSGFAITKADIFSAVAAQGAGQIALNITIPALMFSRIIPSLSTSNIHALGPLVLVAVVYQVMGLLIAVTVKEFFWVPHRFRYGILVAGVWGNSGDIPTSIVMSVCGSAPFNGTADQDLAVAYISLFLLVFMVTLFPMGGHTLVAKDFEGPGVEDDDMRESMRKKRKAMVTGWIKLFRRALRQVTPQHVDDDDLEEKSSDCKSGEDGKLESGSVVLRPAILPRDLSMTVAKHVSFHHEDGAADVVSPEMVMASRVTSPAPTTTHVESTAHADNPPHGGSPRHALPLVTTPSQQPSHLRRILRASVPIIRSICMPASVSIIISFPIAMIKPLKGLFVPVPNSGIPNAPDGLPPLSFILDAATFLGGASVPLGLICLGSALARLKVPRSQFNSLPLGAISGIAIGRMIVSPVVGVAICQALTKAGVIDPNDKVLRLVCILLSCLPTATTQIFLTQVNSGTGSAEHLPAFLIPQYILLLLSMTGLLVYTLHLLI